MIRPFGKRKKSPLLDLRLMADKATSDPRRDETIRGSIAGICRSAFPDNGHNTWEIRKALHIGATTYLLVEPHPKDVGDDRFVFYLRFRPGVPLAESPAVYCLSSDSEYDLLCTAQNCPDGIPESPVW